MAFTGNFMCTSFKKELLEAKHNFLASGGNSFKLALYTNSASFYCGYHRIYEFKRSIWN